MTVRAYISDLKVRTEVRTCETGANREPCVPQPRGNAASPSPSASFLAPLRPHISNIPVTPDKCLKCGSPSFALHRRMLASHPHPITAYYRAPPPPPPPPLHQSSPSSSGLACASATSSGWTALWAARGFRGPGTARDPCNLGVTSPRTRPHGGSATRRLLLPARCRAALTGSRCPAGTRRAASTRGTTVSPRVQRDPMQRDWWSPGHPDAAGPTEAWPVDWAPIEVVGARGLLACAAAASATESELSRTDRANRRQATMYCPA
jgi:hypothetical protein